MAAKPLQSAIMTREGMADIFGSLAENDYWHKFSGGDLPFDVLVRFARDDDGRVVISGVIFGADHSVDVTARNLRQIRPAALIADVVRKAEADDDFVSVIYGELLGPLAGTYAGPRARPGRRGYDDDHFRQIADLYRRALIEQPDKPVLWMIDRLDRRPAAPTVRRWLDQARERGFLGPSIPGKAGEAAKPKKARRRQS